uniref:Uncharacterized protein n=1 Tax=Arundo donax TaxID=35708 RepID=A0A0A8ZGL2_ARUDO
MTRYNATNILPWSLLPDSGSHKRIISNSRGNANIYSFLPSSLYIPLSFARRKILFHIPNTKDVRTLCWV